MKAWNILLSSLCLLSCNQQEKSFEKYVNPLIGTDIRIVQGKDKSSTEERGQIMPAVGVPHGMTNWVAQSQATEQKCHPPYYFFQDAIQGFRASHWMNGSCTQDYGSVTIMPLSNKLEVDPLKRASAYGRNLHPFLLQRIIERLCHPSRDHRPITSRDHTTRFPARRRSLYCNRPKQ